MRQDTNPSVSRIKLRPEGALPTDLNHRYRSEQKRKKRDSRRIISKRRTSHTESNTLFSIIKGLVTIAAIAAILYWTVSLPFKLPYLNKTTQTAAAADTTQTGEQTTKVITETNVKKTDDTEIETMQSGQVAVNEVKETNTEIAGSAITDSTPADDIKIKMITSDSSTTPNTIQTDNTEEDSLAQTDDIKIEKITSNETAEPQQTDITTGLKAETSGQQATEAKNTSAESTVTIKTYRATMFSTLTDDANESHVPHGAAVKLLERKGDWVKIQVIDGGAVGYIHITQLNK